MYTYITIFVVLHRTRCAVCKSMFIHCKNKKKMFLFYVQCIIISTCTLNTILFYASVEYYIWNTIPLFKKGYMVCIFHTNCFVFYKKVEKFDLIASKAMLSFKFGVRQCIILISNKSFSIMSIRHIYFLT